MAGRYDSYDAIFSDGGYTWTKEDNEARAIARHFPTTPFSRNMGEVLKGRQLFSTEDGRFGFGDLGLQKGDVVCIFSGAVTPHVLRKVSEQERKYTLVATAYVHGMMNGEIQELGLEAEDIYLI